MNSQSHADGTITPEMSGWEVGNSSGRMVASLDRKRLGAREPGRRSVSSRGVFDKETRRKPLVFAADAGYGN